MELVWTRAGKAAAELGISGSSLPVCCRNIYRVFFDLPDLQDFPFSRQWSMGVVASDSKEVLNWIAISPRSRALAKPTVLRRVV